MSACSESETVAGEWQALLSPETDAQRVAALERLRRELAAAPQRALPETVETFLKERCADSLLEGALLGLILARRSAEPPSLPVLARVLPALTFTHEADLRAEAQALFARIGRAPRAVFGEIIDAFALEELGLVEVHYYYKVLGALKEDQLPAAPRAPERSPAAAPPVKNPGPRFTPASFDRHAQLFDPRCGFSVGIPGFPVDEREPALTGLPRHEIFLADDRDQIALLYQRDVIPAGPQPGPLALALATAVVTNRGGDPASVRAVPASWLQRFRAAGAAMASYQAKASGLREDLLVLRQGESVVYLYKLSSGATHPFRLKLYSVAVDNSICFVAPGDPAPAPPQLFPRDSDFLGWGLKLELVGFAEDLAERARDAPTADDARRALWTRLDQLLGGSEPHTQVVSEMERETLTTYLTDAVSDPVMQAVLRDGMARVKTAFDLRGLLFALRPAVGPVIGAGGAGARRG